MNNAGIGVAGRFLDTTLGSWRKGNADLFVTSQRVL